MISFDLEAVQVAYLNVRGAVLFLGVLVASACIVIGIIRIDWHKTLAAFRDLDYSSLALGVVLLLACYVGFADRWRRLLDLPVKRRSLFGYIMVGYMTNAVLPMHTGDLVRATLLHHRDKVPIGAALSTIVIERLLDILTIVFFGFALTFHVNLPPIIRGAVQTFAFLAIGGIVGLLIISVSGTPMDKIVAAVPGLRRTRAAAFLAMRAEEFRSALSVLHRWQRLPMIVGVSIAAWSALSFALVAFTTALHINVPWTAGYLVAIVTSLGATIPGLPASVGVYHALAVMALGIWSVDLETAVAYALVTHSTSVALQIGLGGIYSLKLGIDVAAPSTKYMGDLGQSQREDP